MSSDTQSFSEYVPERHYIINVQPEHIPLIREYVPGHYVINSQFEHVHHFRRYNETMPPTGHGVDPDNM